ncbi:hypothetical protein SBC1_29130 [Caballeronia sp. SBC1]|nr:hypothetical protein SBC1_29130 [Caballeronia sp. SBC1]
MGKNSTQPIWPESRTADGFRRRLNPAAAPPPLVTHLFLVPRRYPFLKLPIGVPYTWHSSHESANSFPAGGFVGRRTGFPRFYSLS